MVEVQLINVLVYLVATVFILILYLRCERKKEARMELCSLHSNRAITPNRP